MYKLLKKDAKFMWTDECQIAFDKLKQAIIDALPVQLPDYTKPFYVETDDQFILSLSDSMLENKNRVLLSKSC